MSANKSIIQLYNPALLSEQDLIDSFIVRQSEYQRIMEDILRSEMKFPEQDYLIQGLRGMGKTTLLRRIAYQIEKEEKLKDWLTPIVFPEEQYGIHDLASLWMAVAEALEQKHLAFSGLSEKLTASLDAGNEEICFEILLRALKNAGKKIILFIDNVGDLFNKLTERETHRFREILIKTAELRIICADARILEHTYDYGKPFFDFFKVVPLQGLKREDVFALLTMLAEKNGDTEVLEILKNQPQRIDALRQFTGGVIRTIVFLYEILKENKTEEAFSDLQAILDRVTPLYKHRMDDLKPQQQRIVHHIAMAWESVTAGEIAAKVSLPVKAVSAQLAQLEKNGIIEIVKQEHTKNHLYRIAERFFNIWYLMRMGGGKARERMKWLSRFMEIWFDGDELKNKVEGFIKKLNGKEGINPNAVLLINEAFLGVKGLDIQTRGQLHEAVAEYNTFKKPRLGREYLEADLILYSAAISDINSNSFLEAKIKLEQITNPSIGSEILLAMIYSNLKNELAEEERWMKIDATITWDKSIFQSIIGIVLALKLAGFNKDKTNNFYAGCFRFDLKITSLLYFIFIFSSPGKEKKSMRVALPRLKKHNLFVEAALGHLWLNEINEAIENWEKKESKNLLMNVFFYLLLAKKQFNRARSLFFREQGEFQDQNTALHYTILHFLQKDYPTEYNRMPPELKETVESMVAKVKQMEIDYA